MDACGKMLLLCSAVGAGLSLCAWLAVSFKTIAGKYLADSSRSLPPVTRLIFLAFLGAAVVWGGGKSGGRVEFPRTNAQYELLKDSGSSVSNDFVTVAYTRHAILPDEAGLQIHRRPWDSTNATDWVEHLVTTVGAFPSPQTIPFPAATNWTWSVFTTWHPAPAVQTNGVLHVEWRGTNSAPGRVDAIPLRTEVKHGMGFVFAPPRNPALDKGKSILEVTIPEGGGDFGFAVVEAPAGTKISWGDGSETEYTQKTHHYPLGGKYVVAIGKEATHFRVTQAWVTTTAVFRFLAWGDNITYADWAFQGCTGMYGGVPAWNDRITSASYTYSGCTGLTGAIPAWGASITSAAYAYYGCTGLTSLWADNLTDEEIMPSRITSTSGCVNATSAELRAHFYTSWGGTKPVPTE